jgi:hypothetical protein
MPSRIQVAGEFDAAGFESGLADLITKANPDFDLEATQQDGAQSDAAAAEEAARKIVEEGAVLKDKLDDKPAATQPEGETEGAKAEREAAEEAARVAAESETPEAKAERERVAAEEKAKADKAKEDDPDKDLESRTKELTDGPHVRPKTKQLAEFLKGEAKTARAAQRALAKEKAILEARLAEAEKARPATAEVPKEITEELAQLRSRVQELDATQDPALVAKFDKPVERNRLAIIDTLKQYGLGKTEDGQDDPQAVTDLQAAGLSFKTLKPFLDKMDAEGEVDAAEAIRDALRENIRLSRDKVAEIQAIKGNASQRIQARTEEQQAQIEGQTKRITEYAKVALAADLDAIKKDFPEMDPPPKPLPTDSVEVANAKKAAIAAYDREQAAIGETVKGFSTGGRQGEDLVKAHGRQVAMAVQAAILSKRVVPRLQATIKSQLAELTSLREQVNKGRKAAGITRAHSVAVGSGTAKEGEFTTKAEESTADALARFARGQGHAA